MSFGKFNVRRYFELVRNAVYLSDNERTMIIEALETFRFKSASAKVIRDFIIKKLRRR